MSLQTWLNGVWYRKKRPPWWLMPLSLAYGGAAAARRFAYRGGLRRVVRLPAPVVIVGNLSVGGTGKTPLVAWLAMRLAERGYRPGIVTRGYGGTSRHARLITTDDDPREVGDEPLLLARRTGMPVASGHDRPAAARLLIGGGCQVILSDDGLQHYALARDCEIAVIDGEREFGNGWLLPAGPLREPRARLEHVDAVVINGGTAPPPGKIVMRLEARRAIALAGGAAKPLDEFTGASVHAIAGIGHPERFFSMLLARGIKVTPHALDDHASIDAGDLSFEDDKPVLMTEKDAVKCAKLGDARHWYVPVEACFSESDAHSLLGILLRAINAHRQRSGEV